MKRGWLNLLVGGLGKIVDAYHLLWVNCFKAGFWLGLSLHIWIVNVSEALKAGTPEGLA